LCTAVDVSNMLSGTVVSICNPRRPRKILTGNELVKHKINHYPRNEVKSPYAVDPASRVRACCRCSQCSRHAVTIWRSLVEELRSSTKLRQIVYLLLMELRLYGYHLVAMVTLLLTYRHKHSIRSCSAAVAAAAALSALCWLARWKCWNTGKCRIKQTRSRSLVEERSSETKREQSCWSLHANSWLRLLHTAR